MIDDRIYTLKALAWTQHPKFGRTVELHIRGYGFKEGIFAIKNIEWEEIDIASQTEPTFNISQETAQELMDSLWSCGLRPSESAGSAGQLEAVKSHLEDMRQIAFKFLGKE